MSNVKYWYKGIFVVGLMLLKMLPVSNTKDNQFSWNVFIKMYTSISITIHEAWLDQVSFLHKIIRISYNIHIYVLA